MVTSCSLAPFNMLGLKGAEEWDQCHMGHSSSSMQPHYLQFLENEELKFCIYPFH
jgi:hypothetical protein